MLNVVSAGIAFNFGVIETKEDLLLCLCEATLDFIKILLFSTTSLSLQID